MSAIARRSLCRSLSDWEVVEMYTEHTRRGTALSALGERYGLSEKGVRRAFKRLRRTAQEMGMIA